MSETCANCDCESPNTLTVKKEPINWNEWIILAVAASLLVASFLVPQTGTGGIIAWTLSGLAWIGAGRNVLWSAIKKIGTGDFFDENFLMGFASLAAFALGEHQEGAAVMVFFLVGETLQDQAVARSRNAIASSLDLKPESARRIARAGDKHLPKGLILETLVHPQDLVPGDHIRVRLGERVPADGRLLSAQGSLDTSTLTGESVPRNYVTGDQVLSGSLVATSPLDLEVTALAQESAAARIIALIEEAQHKKAKTERFITSFARWYTPAVVFGAIGLALLNWLAFGLAPSDAIHRSLVMLVISCPCALVVSVPLAYFAGIGGLARRGILTKGATVFDSLHSIKAVAFDKTGTLTQGTFTVLATYPASGTSSSDLVALAIQAEAHSNHPVAKAIKAHGQSLGLSPQGHGDIDGFSEHTGRGVSQKTASGTIRIGSQKFLEEQGITLPNAEIHGPTDTPRLRLHLALDHVYHGSLELGDTIRPQAKSTIAKLRTLGVAPLSLISGDDQEATQAVATTLGMDSWHGACLPGQKLSTLESIMADLGTKAKGATTMFVGDGINDGPVISRADVGVAMGRGAQDIAVECADLVIMHDDPSHIPLAINHAKRVRAVVIQNIVFALTVKTIFMAAGSFGLAGMWEAIIADVGVALLAILNSLRVLGVSDRPWSLR